MPCKHTFICGDHTHRDPFRKPDVGGAYYRITHGGYSVKEGCTAVVVGVKQWTTPYPLVRFLYTGSNTPIEYTLENFNAAFVHWDGR